MDKFCISTTKNKMKNNSDRSTDSTDSTDRSVNPISSTKFDETILSPNIFGVYTNLPSIQKHAFRIAFEQLGSSFDPEQLSGFT